MIHCLESVQFFLPFSPAPPPSTCTFCSSHTELLPCCEHTSLFPALPCTFPSAGKPLVPPVTSLCSWPHFCLSRVCSSKSSSSIFSGTFVLSSVKAFSPLYSYLSVSLDLCLPFSLQEWQRQCSSLYRVLPDTASSTQRRYRCWVHELEFVHACVCVIRILSTFQIKQVKL